MWVEPDMDEQEDLLKRFTDELRKATADGKTKRGRGEKEPWYIDDTHEDALHRHFFRWANLGETEDIDSGAHPLVHMAWRALAIACKETGNVPRV